MKDELSGWEYVNNTEIVDIDNLSHYIHIVLTACHVLADVDGDVDVRRLLVTFGYHGYTALSLSSSSV